LSVLGSTLGVFDSKYNNEETGAVAITFDD